MFKINKNYKNRNIFCSVVLPPIPFLQTAATFRAKHMGNNYVSNNIVFPEIIASDGQTL